MTAIFDTHAHSDDDAFNDDREQLLAALPGQGIARVVDVGASLASCRKVLELMEQYDYIYGAIGRSAHGPAKTVLCVQAPTPPFRLSHG